MKLIIPAILITIFSACAFAQETVTETQKIDEFGVIYCCNFGVRLEFAMIAQRANPGSRVYMHFYEGKKRAINHWNKRLGKSVDVLINPMRGGFSDFLAGVRIRAGFQKIDLNNFVIQNGGFREVMTVEVWLVPAGAEPPKLTPTVDGKSVRYRKGRFSHFQNVCNEI